jgi:hypothetical protein
MKAILLALAAGILLLGLGTWRLRVEGARGAATLLTVFLAVLPVLVLAHVLTPAGFWLFPVDLQIQPAAVSLAFALFLYAAGFFGGILQLYNLAERGFSLRILIDILHAPKGAMTLDEVMTGYSDGRSIAWMYGKRIDGMRTTGLVIGNKERLVLTERGRRIARLFAWLQRSARLKEDE